MSIISQIMAEHNEKIAKESLCEIINDSESTEDMIEGAKGLYKKLETKGVFSE